MKLKHYFLCICVIHLVFQAQCSGSSSLFPRKHNFTLFTANRQKALQEKILLKKQMIEDEGNETLIVRKIVVLAILYIKYRSLISLIGRKL